MYTACTNNKRPAGQSIRQFITMGLEFCSHLSMHHSIEEQHVFPLLAKKMPEFRKGDDLLKQHRGIHAGMDKLEAYLSDCRCGETDFSLAEVKKLMDTFGAVLWAHLDDEIRTLGAENMRKYWTLEEMRRLPM
jgi:hemerythrin-like domain-containing protein